jgi:hypothetical protein
MTLMSKCKYESEEKEECLLFDELWCPCSAYEEQKEEEEEKDDDSKKPVVRKKRF